VNVPVLRTFVEKMYPVAQDLANRKKHTLVCGDNSKTVNSQSLADGDSQLCIPQLINQFVDWPLDN